MRGPPGLIMVGERGPEWYRPANDNNLRSPHG